MKSWVLAFRPKTLTAAVIPIIAATGLAYTRNYAVDWMVFWCALGSALMIQIATNLFNDAIDFTKGADTAERLGPVRATASGLISQIKVMWMGFATLAFAVALGIPLVMKGGMIIVAIGMTSLFLAYLYTGGPFPLAYVGLGDVFVILFFGLIAVGGVYFLHTGIYDIGAFVLGLQIGALSTVLIAINNMRDVEQDKKANKNTLAVRFGIQFVRAEIATLIIGTFLLQIFWYYQVGPKSALIPVLFFPLGLHIIKSVRQESPSQRYNQFLAKSALLHAGFGILLSVGFYMR